MEVYSNLQPHECLSRIEYLLEPGSVAEKITSQPKYSFRDGSSRMASDVNGTDFSLTLLGRSKYGSVDPVGRFCGCASQSAHGGSVISGTFVLCNTHILAMILLPILAAFPLVIILAQGRPVASLGNGFLPMWFGCMGVFVTAFAWGFFSSRRLLSNFLRDLLDATPQRH